MKVKFRHIIVAALVLIVFLCISFLNTLQNKQQVISSKIIRIHVLANSDDDNDQQMKLFVRDEVNRYVAEILKNVNNKTDALKIISSNVADIENAAQNAVILCGGDYPVSVSLGEESYPTREYENLSLPAGKYTSLKISIGEGSGENWWCVVYPPLCTEAAKDTVTEAYFTESEAAFITGDDKNVKLEFKILEIINDIKTYFKDKN